MEVWVKLRRDGVLWGVMVKLFTISPGPGPPDPYFPPLPPRFTGSHGQALPAPLLPSLFPRPSLGPALQPILFSFGISNGMRGLAAILELHSCFRSSLANIALGNRLR